MDQTFMDDAAYWDLTPLETTRWLVRLSRYHARRARYFADRAVRLADGAKRTAWRASIGAVAALVVALGAVALILLSGCSGFSAGQADPGAASRGAQDAGQKAQDFVILNGHLVASILLALGGVALIKFLWKSPQIRIIGAALVGGAVVYYAMGGAR